MGQSRRCPDCDLNSACLSLMYPCRASGDLDNAGNASCCAVQDAVDSSEDTQAQWEPQEQPSMLSMLRSRERNRSGWTGGQQ